MKATRILPEFTGPAVDLDEGLLCWDGLVSPPLLMNHSGARVAAALDGRSTIAQIAEHLSRVTGPTSPSAEQFALVVDRLAETFAAYGLMEGRQGYTLERHEVTIGRQLTVCDERRYRLSDAVIFIVDAGHRQLSVAVADPRLAVDFINVLGDRLVEGTRADLNVAPLELAVVPADPGPRLVGEGLHHLYGPDNRTLVRTTDLGTLFDAALGFIGNELAVGADPDAVWFRGSIFENRAGEAFIVSPSTFRIWKTNWRRVERAGYALRYGSNVRLEPDGSALSVPQVAIEDHGTSEQLSKLSSPRIRPRITTTVKWDRFAGAALQSEGGTHIGSWRSEAAFEITHQAFLVNLAAGGPIARVPPHHHAMSVLTAARGLAHRLPRYRSARLDHEFIEALLDAAA